MINLGYIFNPVTHSGIYINTRGMARTILRALVRQGVKLFSALPLEHDFKWINSQ